MGFLPHAVNMPRCFSPDSRKQLDHKQPVYWSAGKSYVKTVVYPQNIFSTSGTAWNKNTAVAPSPVPPEH